MPTVLVIDQLLREETGLLVVHRLWRVLGRVPAVMVTGDTDAGHRRAGCCQRHARGPQASRRLAPRSHPARGARRRKRHRRRIGAGWIDTRRVWRPSDVEVVVDDDGCVVGEPAAPGECVRCGPTRRCVAWPGDSRCANRRSLPRPGRGCSTTYIDRAACSTSEKHRPGASS